MANYQQTKGYTFLAGKVKGIDGKKPYNNGSKNTLTFRVETNKGNTIFATIGDWITSTRTVKLKAQGMEQADEIPMGEVADMLQDYFHDGDDVLIRASIDINTYKDRLDVAVSGIYACSDEIDFNSEKFEERNETKISGIVASEFNEKELSVIFVSYKGETVTQVLRTENEVIKEFLTGVRVGDLIPFTLSFVNRPIYETVVDDTSKGEPARKTLLGKTVGGESQKQKRKIVGNENLIIIQDIDVEKIEPQKYKLEEDKQDLPF